MPRLIRSDGSDSGDGQKETTTLDASSPKCEKVEYVKSQKKNDGTHMCHWPGCELSVPPAKWGCYKHWMMLPRYLRKAIWDAYRPGQEMDKRPSKQYLLVAKSVQLWIFENYGVEGGDA